MNNNHNVDILTSALQSLNGDLDGHGPIDGFDGIRKNEDALKDFSKLSCTYLSSYGQGRSRDFLDGVHDTLHVHFLEPVRREEGIQK